MAHGEPESQLTLRDCTDDDGPFLRELYASTRADELALMPWSPEQQAAFVRQQFDAQDRHYRAAYPACRRSVVLVDGRPAGRLYVERGPESILVVDVSLLPECRGRGIGTALLTWLLAEAAERGSVVSLHVVPGNPAARLYQRLGFVPVGGTDTHVRMEWRPPVDLATLSADDFEAVVGDRFAVATGGPELALVLRSVERRRPVPELRQPFALFFDGPVEPMLGQASWRLRHEGLGAMEIFLVPVDRDAEACRYQAVFG